MKQLSLFDLIEEPRKNIPCGYIEDTSLVGREIKFTDLKSMKGLKVILGTRSRGNISYKVVRIVDYFENCDTYYKRVRELPSNQIGYGEIVNSYIHDVCGIKECMECYEPYFVCDRVSYSDKERCKGSNCYMSEVYCSSSRYPYNESYDEYADTFYYLNA